MTEAFRAGVSRRLRFVNLIRIELLVYTLCLPYHTDTIRIGYKVATCPIYVLPNEQRLSINHTVQGSTNRRAPGCENAAGKLRQKW